MGTFSYGLEINAGALVSSEGSLLMSYTCSGSYNRVVVNHTWLTCYVFRGDEVDSGVW